MAAVKHATWSILTQDATTKQWGVFFHACDEGDQFDRYVTFTKEKTLDGSDVDAFMVIRSDKVSEALTRLIGFR